MGELTILEAIGIIIAILATVLAAIYFMLKKAFNNGINNKTLEDLVFTVKKLPCIQYKESIDETKRRVDENNKSHNLLNEAFNKSTETLDVISKWIMKQDPEMIDLIAIKKSPYKMTPVGKVLFEKSTAKKAMEDNIDYLLSALKEIDPKTPYDVEDSALSVLIQNMSHNLFIGVKDYLYNSPSEVKIMDSITKKEISVPLSIQSILKLMSIHLREMYLEKYPEIEKNSNSTN